MNVGDLLPTLALITLIVVAGILAIVLANFLRKRKNRHPMDTPEGKAAEEMRRREAEEERRDEHRSEL